MSKVYNLKPCVCIDHQPTEADSVYYGMPLLKTNGKYFIAYCPKCGRGGCLEFPSAYLALKNWNKIIETIERIDDGIFTTDKEAKNAQGD